MKKISLILSAFYLYFLSKISFVFAEPLKTETLLPAGNEIFKNNVHLPSGLFSSAFIPAIVKIVLRVGGTLVLIGLIVSGVLFITAQGQTEKIDSAKKIITYTVIGLIIMAVSYAIIYGVAQINFL